jgi:hypothetical protein
VNRGRELLVGFVILSALAVGVVGTYYLQGTNFGQPQVARDILVRTVGQLNRGNSVKYLGVNIGRIEAFGVIGTAVRVSMLLDEDVVLPGDAAVILGPESMFGDWQAEIVSMAEYPRYEFYQLPVDAPPGVLPGYALPEMSRLTASAEQIADNLAQLSDRRTRLQRGDCHSARVRDLEFGGDQPGDPRAGRATGGGGYERLGQRGCCAQRGRRGVARGSPIVRADRRDSLRLANRHHRGEYARRLGRHSSDRHGPI